MLIVKKPAKIEGNLRLVNFGYKNETSNNQNQEKQGPPLQYKNITTNVDTKFVASYCDNLNMTKKSTNPTK